jgi:hypothetical protein
VLKSLILMSGVQVRKRKLSADIRDVEVIGRNTRLGQEYMDRPECCTVRYLLRSNAHAALEDCL